MSLLLVLFFPQVQVLEDGRQHFVKVVDFPVVAGRAGSTGACCGKDHRFHGLQIVENIVASDVEFVTPAPC